MSADEVLRYAGTRAFVLRTELDRHELRSRGDDRRRPVRGDEYFALWEHPELARFALGHEVIVVPDGTAYESARTVRPLHTQGGRTTACNAPPPGPTGAGVGGVRVRDGVRVFQRAGGSRSPVPEKFAKFASSPSSQVRHLHPHTDSRRLIRSAGSRFRSATHCKAPLPARRAGYQVPRVVVLGEGRR